MSVRFVHTADWQLGKPFASIADETKRAALQAERDKAIDRIGDLARAEGAAFVVVAGDMFDSASPKRSVVSRACSSIGKMGVPVIVIPGNHDHGAPGSVWHQPFLLEEAAALAPNLRVLLEPAPFVVGGAVVLPCPLRRRHESADVTTWLRNAPAMGQEQSLPRIILAHGAVQEFGTLSRDDEEDTGEPINFIDITRLPESEYDYFALGDWHGTKQVGRKAWYSGTPEIDRYPKGEANLPGNVLLVDVSRGSDPSVGVHRIGRVRWHDLQYTMHDDNGVDELIQMITERIGTRTFEDLLRVTLDGQLGIVAMAKLDRVRETQESRLLRLNWNANVVVSPTEDEILALTSRAQDPIISRVATNLVTYSRSSDAGGALVARTALRALHLAIQQKG